MTATARGSSWDGIDIDAALAGVASLPPVEWDEPDDPGPLPEGERPAKRPEIPQWFVTLFEHDRLPGEKIEEAWLAKYGQTHTAFECVAETTEPEDLDDWLVDGLIRPGALGILASAEGIGKSYARLELALRLSTGTGSLFGHYPIAKPGRVVLVDEENGPAEEYRRECETLAALGLDRAALTSYFRVSYAGMNLCKPERQEWLRAALDPIAPDLAILDTGGAMVGDEWGEPLKEAVRFLRSLPCAVLVCVHLTKPPRDNHRGSQHGTALADVMGQWTRSADVVAVMADLGAGRARWTVRKRVPPSSLVLAQRGGLWDVVAVADDHEAASTDTRVLRAIAAGASTADELRIALGTADRALPKRTLYDALARLRTDGLLAAGTPYSLTPDGMESAG